MFLLHSFLKRSLFAHICYILWTVWRFITLSFKAGTLVPESDKHKGQRVKVCICSLTQWSFLSVLCPLGTVVNGHRLYSRTRLDYIRLSLSVASYGEARTGTKWASQGGLKGGRLRSPAHRLLGLCGFWH